jgi:LuxR family maltose regulon positive regulatory protein
MGLALSSEEIEALEVRTEGWIASLKLAALSLQGSGDKHDFVEDFSGSNRYIMDYLMDEVMSRQSEEVQTFLCQTSIFDRFCASLCDDVLEISNSRQIITKLDQANLFLIPLDEVRHWFRYHYIFADFLKQRLYEKNKKKLPKLHRQASRWYETHGQIDEAIEHALSSGDLERVAYLVEKIAASLIIRKEFNKLMRWINLLPDGMRQNHPLLCVYNAWALLFTEQMEEVEPMLKIAEASQHMVSQIPISAYVTTIRAFQTTRMWDMSKAILLAKKALKQMSSASLDQSTLIHQGGATLNLADNYRICCDLTKARQFYTESIALNQKADNIFALLGAFWSLGDIAKTQGQLRRAVEIYKRGLQAAAKWLTQNEYESAPFLVTDDLHLRLGAVLYQLNDLTGSATHIQRAIELFELEENWDRLLSYKMMAYLHQATGEYKAALDMLVKSSEIYEILNFHKLYPYQDPMLIDLHIILSRAVPGMEYLLQEVEDWIKTCHLKPDDIFDYAHEYEYRHLSRGLVALGRAGEAIPLLDRLVEASKAGERNGDTIEYLTIQAMAHFSLGDTASALNAFSQSLTMAEPEGYIRIFVDEGQPMMSLLKEAKARGVSSGYVDQLIAAFPLGTKGSRTSSRFIINSSSQFVEPLSGREVEVLRLLAAGLKYDEIGDQLFISLNTVRTHVKNIYSKFNVSSRTEALIYARELNLV